MAAPAAKARAVRKDFKANSEEPGTQPAKNSGSEIDERSSRIRSSRAVVAILNQLEDAGIIIRNREGRRNSYDIDLEALKRFPRWSPGEWDFPPQLIQVAAAGLRSLMRG